MRFSSFNYFVRGIIFKSGNEIDTVITKIRKLSVVIVSLIKGNNIAFLKIHFSKRIVLMLFCISNEQINGGFSPGRWTGWR